MLVSNSWHIHKFSLGEPNMIFSLPNPSPPPMWGNRYVDDI